MTKTLGPTFGDELDAAGLAGLPISWSEDGDVFGRENLSAEQDVALQAVIEAHDASHLPMAALKAEAFGVITGVISTTAQLNLSATMAVIAGAPVEQRSAQEQEFAETYAAGVAWIHAIRRRMTELAALGGATPEGEPRWPEPSQVVRDLAAAY